MAQPDADIPLNDGERELAERGRLLVATAVEHPEARAPQALREALAGAAAPSSARRRPRARLVAGLGGLAAAAVAAALVFALAEDRPDDAPRAPSLEQVAAVARRPATAPAPAAIGGSPPRLDARVGRLSFPDWREAYEWRATGRRSDRLGGGRAVTTVFYRYAHGDEATIAYAIVAGPPLGVGAGREVRRRGERYRVFQRAGRRTVTWTQAGHTCVIDAPSTVSATELVKLASWA